jgi:hypothetical protein
MKGRLKRLRPALPEDVFGAGGCAGKEIEWRNAELHTKIECEFIV